MADNTWQKWLKGQPQADYTGLLESLNRTPAAGWNYQNPFPNMFTRYLGQLGSTTGRNLRPMNTFANYLSQYPFQPDHKCSI